MSDLQVDPAELLRAANRLAEQADEARDRAARLTGLDGGRRSARYRQALETMGGRLHRHATELDTLADRLRAAARGYERTDATAAAAFRRISGDRG